MKFTWQLLAGIALALGFATFVDPGEAHALDCGQRLVVVGDSAVYVRAQCGAPALVSTRTETRWQGGWWNGPGGGLAGGTAVTVQVEVWVYDFGPRRYMEEITFEGGVVRETRHLGRGTARGKFATRK